MATPQHTTSHPWSTMLVGALIGAAALLALGPHPAGLGSPTGDTALAGDASAALATATHLETVSVARIRDGAASWAGFGEVTPDSRYELGSITKTFDGLLLADAAQRGEVGIEDPLETHLTELAGTEVGSATLAELVSHRAGLPSLLSLNMVRVVAEDLAGAALSVYTATTPDELIRQSGALALSGRGTMQYSNLGASLLGFALTRAAGMPDWPSYVHQRLLAPLGMNDTAFAEPGRPAPDLMQPHQGLGSPTEAWTGSGYAPAGLGVTTTAADLTRYAQAILDGTAPGIEALDARWPAMMGWQIGLAWIVTDIGDGPVAFHNGGTGGTRTMLAIDRTHERAAIVLNNSTQDVTGAGLALAGVVLDDSLAPPPFDTDTVAWVGLGIPLVLLFAVGAVRGRSRTRLMGQGLAAAGTLLMWWLAAPWDWSAPWIFGASAGLAVAATVVVVRRWAHLPWMPTRWRLGTLIVLALGSAWLVAMVTLAVWVATIRP
ncbi:beta-lactamase family protein [Tessaracoccus sp. MC1627]|uniref:serine hydrolase domain-containing protein n=1 Tax=Tessaracoccus sp. MC1627 TaxID=2760312 RepID=UPI0015FF4B43|nr:serine hydrolase domain-containing protein [Tessaracoccus sp. MC1627]MBB1513861.1 beta-lactamase family protein [Tessaracoccus sp. MC1627]